MSGAGPTWRAGVAVASAVALLTAPAARAARGIDLEAFEHAVAAEALAQETPWVAARRRPPPAEVQVNLGGPIALLASGLALVVGGIVAGVVKEDLDRASAGELTLEEARGAEEVVFATSVTADSLFFIGGGLIIGGGIWMALEITQEPPSPASTFSAPEAYQPTSWQTGPLPGPTAPVPADVPPGTVPPIVPEGGPGPESVPIGAEAPGAAATAAPGDGAAAAPTPYAGPAIDAAPLPDGAGAAVPGGPNGGAPPAAVPPAPGVPADRDSDGAPDASDACPQVKGVPTNQGCPDGDEDRDGLAGALDQCPRYPGPTWSSGCPGPDSDGDGIPDSADECLLEPGTHDQRGCPASPPPESPPASPPSESPPGESPPASPSPATPPAPPPSETPPAPPPAQGG